MLGSSNFEDGDDSDGEKSSRKRFSSSRSPRKTRSAKPTRPTKDSRAMNVEREVLKHRNETVVTPIVARIAKSLFERALEVAGQSRFDEIDDDVAMEIDDVQAHHLNPKNMQWGEREFEDKSYDTVIMDGVTYSVRILFLFINVKGLILTGVFCLKCCLQGWRSRYGQPGPR